MILIGWKNTTIVYVGGETVAEFQKMVRLIDANALNKTLQERVGSPVDDKVYMVNRCIIDASTIEAIPIDWLRQKAIGFDDPFNCFMRVMFAWFKEQREGTEPKEE